MSAVRATLRIARRDARRARGRSALVIGMIALPVLGVGAADVLYRTFQLSPDQKASRTMGAADAILSDTGLAHISQNPGPYAGYDGNATRQGPAPSPTSVLPVGSRVLADRQAGQATVTAGDATASAALHELAYTDPLARGRYLPRSGRAPRAASEVSVTRSLAGRLAIGLGARLALRMDKRVWEATVVGLVDDGDSRRARTVLLWPGTLPADAASSPLLVQAGHHLTWADVERVNAAGFQLVTRAAVPGQPAAPAQSSGVSNSALTAVSLVVGMALLEVVLLAGPAFAVGAKRQSRELALLSATGGERRHVRGVVLGGGVVLGAVGGLIGVLLGTGLGRLAVPRLSDYTGSVPGPFEVPPLELAAIAATGVLTAVLAALLPARSAGRQDVVAALTGRRGQLRSLRRVPLLGLAAAVAGTLLALEGARQRSVNTILAGSAVAELGLVAMTPFLVGFVGRLGPWLPVGPRLALRDSARNRSRTAPAVAAVLAAVAGSVAVGTYLASLDRYHERYYRSNGPYGAAVVSLAGSGAHAPEAERALRRTLTDAQVRTVRGLDEKPTAGATDQGFLEVLSCANTRPGCLSHPSLRGHRSPGATLHGVLVGDPAALTALTGRDSSGFAAVLGDGGAVAPAANVRADGQLELVLHPSDDVDGTKGRHLLVTAQALPGDVPQVVLLSERAAARTGYPVVPVGLLATAAGPPSTAQEDRARHELAKYDLDSQLYVERGYQSSSAVGLLSLLIGSAVIVLGASGIATGLAAADGRADLATLAAVGASPGRRRSLAAFQSAVTAGLGTFLGTVAGLVPAVGMVRALNAQALQQHLAGVDVYPLVLPWRNLVVTVVVVPVVAALAAALLTRSRLPMVRRMA